MGQQSKATGFTLIETVVALGVIVAAVVGPVALITRGLFVFSFPRNKVIAANLAQEGLEEIRLIRENNIACGDLDGTGVWPWTADPDGGIMGGTYGVDMQTSFRTLAGAPGVCASIKSPRLLSSYSNPLRLDSASGTYGYQDGTPTAFYRRVQVTLPLNPENPGGGMPSIPAEDLMDVVSTVTWSERGIGRSVSVSERFYNWHY